MRDLFFLPVFLRFDSWQRTEGEVTALIGTHKERRDLMHYLFFHLTEGRIHFKSAPGEIFYTSSNPIPIVLAKVIVAVPLNNLKSSPK